MVGWGKQIPLSPPLQDLLRSCRSRSDIVDHEMKLYEIYYCTNSTPSFINFHQRLQTFLLWFIDAASYVDMDDSGWNFFVVFEKYHCGDEIRYSVVGYASVYDYYAYPEHIRPRISQVLILPPYQSKGLCMKLLFSLYNHYLAEKSNILDFTGMKKCIT
nr:histone acetyltransferase type B catalytic subunit-like [Halyomorpha halys]